MPHLQAEQIAREFADASLPKPDDNVALFPECSAEKVAEYCLVQTYLRNHSETHSASVYRGKRATLSISHFRCRDCVSVQTPVVSSIIG